MRRFRPYLVAWLGCLAVAITAIGATPALDVVDFGRPATRTFTDKDGLPQSSVLAMAVDREGYLWVGTQAGAARYNGHEWTVFDMPDPATSNYVRCILVARDGSLWFGTDGAGLAHFANGAWTSYTTTAGLPHNQILSLLETTGGDGSPLLLVGTAGGLARFARGAWTVEDARIGLPAKPVYHLLETAAPGGRALWAGTSEGIFRLEGGQWLSTPPIPGFDHHVVWDLRETTVGGTAPAVLAGTSAGKLVRLEGEQWVDFGAATGFPGDTVRSVIETVGIDGTPVLWVGTDGGRLARFSNGRWKTYDKTSGLPGISVTSLLETRAGAESLIWVGTNGGGVTRIGAGQWTGVDSSLGLPAEVVRALLATEGEGGSEVFWFGTDNAGLGRLEDGRWTVFDTSNGLPNASVMCLLETTSAAGEKVVWAGTNRGGLGRLEGGRWTVFNTKSGLPHDMVRCLLATTTEDGRPAIWVGTNGGLARFDGARWEVTRPGAGLPHGDIREMIETTDADGGRSLWVGTGGGGIARRRGGEWSVVDTSAGLPSNAIRSLLEVVEPDGRRTLWVGSYGGASWIELDREGARWQTLSETSTPALPDNTVYQIERDRFGRLYFFTPRGVAQLTPRGPGDDPSQFSIYTFTTEDGLPANECNGGAAMVDRRGRIWAGTTRGAGVYVPAAEASSRPAGPLVLERALFGQSNGVLAAGSALDHDENNVEFRYALLSYFREDDTRFRTQLEGFDAAPSDWSAQPRRTYTNLPAGDYVFRAWGRDHAGNVTEPVDFAFSVHPAPWRTWWAYGLYALALAGVVYGGVKVRTRALTRRTTELEAAVSERTADLARKAAELAEAVERSRRSEERALASERAAVEANHSKSVFLSNMSHELRTPLNAVIGFAQLMDRDATIGPYQRENLAIIQRSGEHLLALINDVLSISKIEAGALTLAKGSFDLPATLRSVREMIRIRAEGKGLDLVVVLDPDLPRYVVGDESKLRQVLINLLGNAVKFTERGEVRLRAGWRDDRGRFEIEDTGAGIAADEIGELFEPFKQAAAGRNVQEGTGLGLAISRQIVRLMGGDVEVRSRVGEGTAFRFEVDLPRAGDVAVVAEAKRVIGLEPGQPQSRVLVVDDTAENRVLLTRLLTFAGFDARGATNGVEAVEAWREWDPDLIWMDVRMPVMDGLEATRLIREGNGHATGARRPVILALTASVFEHEREKVLESGADDVVFKPFRVEAIFEKMAEYLGVRFVYDTVAPARSSGDERGTALTPERFAALPAESTSALRQALHLGDPERSLEAANRIRTLDEVLALEVVAMLKAYRFDELLAILEEV